ncbi:MAG: hypothetical protein IJ306_01095 [Oscillospiraceae bacterium]|nr:hypothetical protein [Oscillospiraceae bacterium]
MAEFTYESTKELFVLAWNSNAYLNMCESSDIKNAINALEKQIPKKLDYQADGYADGVLVYDEALCPVCEHCFEESVNDWGSKYCPNCGQALDWSGENG